METITSKRISRNAVLFILLAVLLAVTLSLLPEGFFTWLWDKLNVFATVFLGIFVEAVPYLLLGTFASGLVEVFMDRDAMSRWVSNRPGAAAISGAFMGMVFPVCECGVVPLTRRLFKKGLPLSAGISFLLAAPVLNPIVIISTASAFGWGEMLLWRFVISLVIAVTVGLVFSAQGEAAEVLRPVMAGDDHDHIHAEAGDSVREKIRKALLITVDEFFDMGRYLVLGSMLAAGLQTFVSQSALLAIGSGPVLSVLVMLLLAVILSICSTVDSFVALGFTGVFSFGSVLSFLVFGPMVDIKSVMMYLQVFKRRAVFYIVGIPFLMSLAAGLVFNYFVK
ncbi:MAG: permease [Anaerolineales bacterium]|nr:permease [Anaerolineales bacterium]MCB9146064.1 permease [Anaerolineales bacterium]